MIQRVLLAVVAAGGLAACQTTVVISEVRAERAASGEILVGFKADQDLEQTGLSVMGYFRMPPHINAERPPMADCVADLDPLRRKSPEEYIYACRIPAKAAQPGNFRRTTPAGKLAIVVVNIPYDLSGPGDPTIEFCLLGGGCGFRGLMSNTVTLTVRAP